MLDPDEAQAVAERFGVASAQVARDHLISHVLAALSDLAGDDVVFFGGTALSRTHIPEGRLSEDIDLLAVAGRGAGAARIEPGLPRVLRREFPGVAWIPRPTEVRDSEPVMLQTPDGLGVRIQLLSSTGYAAWPVERRAIVQRYSDAPPATLTVPTAAAFVAWKTVAWFDRRAARDLYDLWSLAEHGHLSADAAELFARFGPTNRPPTAAMFSQPVDEERWRRDLSGQARLRIPAAEALAVVGAGWQALGADADHDEPRESDLGDER